MSQDTIDRAHHFLRILDEGKQFTVELLRQNETLRLANIKLQDELRERDDLVKKTVGPNADQRMAQLDRERREAVTKLEALRAHIASVEAENREFADRYLRIEKQNGNLASLYVATYNLHSTLQTSEVVGCIREIIINLIGSEMFGVYVINEEATGLHLLAHEGLDDPRYKTLTCSGIIDDALKTGRAVVLDTEPSEDSSQPIACAPLVIHHEVLGVIIVYRLLEHKEGFEDVDREFLDMLAGHAATALYSSRLHASAERKLTTLQGFLDMLRVPKTR
jgi:GAF domain-containing protein